MRFRTWTTRCVVVGLTAASALLAGGSGAAASPPNPDSPAVGAAPGGSQVLASAAATVTTERIAGVNRYETSAKIATRAFTSSFGREGELYLARADVFADALAAGSLYYPVLLVPRCGPVPDAVKSAVARLNPDRLTALGGTSSVCQPSIREAAGTRGTNRLAGPDRYETALLMADAQYRPGADVPTVYVASGANGTPDAVAGGVLSDGPILTVSPKGGTSVEEARDWTSSRSVGRVVALGGTSTVSERILRRIAGARPTGRLSGPDRYATAVAIAQKQFKSTAPVAYLARGDVFADAVAAGSLTDGPVFLTESCDLPQAVSGALRKLRPHRVVALGGRSSVCDDVLNQAAAAVGGNAVPKEAPNRIVAGSAHSCATTSRGTYCWGNNSRGKLGIGDAGETSRPVAVKGLAAVDVVSTSGEHTCAARDGSAFCWGENESGQLGTGGGGPASTPRKVLNLSRVSGIDAGDNHTCAINGGALYCWGENRYGQLGTGGTTNSSTPARVSGLTDVNAVALGRFHTCAAASGGTYCWGRNDHGQLGNGTTTNSATPVRVAGLPRADDLSLGSNFSCAVTARTANCWGRNNSGQLGDGTKREATRPVAVVALSKVSEISVGTDHACAINDGRGYCWGKNDFQKLGIAAGGSGSTRPQRVRSLGSVQSISAGSWHTCAVADGSAVCWGSNAVSVLGNGGPGDARTPQRVSEFYRTAIPQLPIQVPYYD